MQEGAEDEVGSLAEEELELVFAEDVEGKEATRLIGRTKEKGVSAASLVNVLSVNSAHSGQIG